MRNFLDQINQKSVKRFVRNWETAKQKDIAYVICHIKDTSKEALNIEARLYNGLFQHISTDYWSFDDFYALVNSPDEHSLNTMQVISEPWQLYLLKQLSSNKVNSEYNAVEYKKTLDYGTPHYMWGHSETSNWPERLL